MLVDLVNIHIKQKDCLKSDIFIYSWIS